jgi:hypothetical protein
MTAERLITATVAFGADEYLASRATINSCGRSAGAALDAHPTAEITKKASINRFIAPPKLVWLVHVELDTRQPVVEIPAMSTGTSVISRKHDTLIVTPLRA